MDAGLVVSFAYNINNLLTFYQEFNFIVAVVWLSVHFGVYLLFIFTLCHSISADEFLYQNQWGEIALLNIGNLSERILMSNTTYVSMKKTNVGISINEKIYRKCQN